MWLVCIGFYVFRLYLTNTDVEKRARGTRLLSSVLQTASLLTLTDAEGIVLVSNKLFLLQNIGISANQFAELI